MIKEMLRPDASGRPKLLLFSTCRGLIRDLAAIQADEENPNDCAREPHEVTHSVDALRYFCVSRTLRGEEGQGETAGWDEDGADYDAFMTGGAELPGLLGYMGF